MEFEWDPFKNNTNLEKHGIDFNCAPSVFNKFHMTVEDTRKDYSEKRLCTMGTTDENRVVIIAHTLRGNINRIISMRKANTREQKIFYNYQKIYLKETCDV